MKKILGFILVMIYTLSFPLLIYAEDEVAETSEKSTMSPIEAIVLLAVFIFVTYKVYRKMYAGTTIIGTRNGIAYEKGRMLFIPAVIGMIVMVAVYKLFRIIKWIIILGVIVGAIILIVKKVAPNNEETQNNNDNIQS